MSFIFYVRFLSEGYSLYDRRNVACRKTLNSNAHQDLTGDQVQDLKLIKSIPILDLF